MNNDPSRPFIMSQIEEALEERQSPERRKDDKGYDKITKSERRKQDRRKRNP